MTLYYYVNAGLTILMTAVDKKNAIICTLHITQKEAGHYKIKDMALWDRTKAYVPHTALLRVHSKFRTNRNFTGDVCNFNLRVK